MSFTKKQKIFGLNLSQVRQINEISIVINSDKDS